MAPSMSHYLTHPAELRAMLQWKLLHAPIYRSDETPGTQTHDLKECWRFLALTSRSFVAVIQQLHPELLMPMCIFYLALRSLDTIEDDMTLPIAVKEPLLRDFDQHLDDETWTFDGSGPDEKDREVLVKFDCVAREYNKLKEEYRRIIADITKRMGAGMADYAVTADTVGVKTIADYELYCHYVAGLVGEGVTRMFVLASLAEPRVMEKPELAEAMAQLLQQTNIIRDVHEDHMDNRHFWPTEVWSKHVDKFSDLFQKDPPGQRKALECMSEMVLMALEKAPDCLSYMANVREQSVFNFVAIPQTMAMATLELCFQNPSVFDRNIKITRGVACQLLIDSVKDLRYVGRAFSRYAAKIQKKNRPEDPNYSKIDAACTAITQSTHRLLLDYKPPPTLRAQHLWLSPHSHY
ncbi:squalene synthetase-like protein [Dothistroma septosporum NZE10]|uniref:squalene synthase n=1 Tax=Dothistroma septosporum (strain NZE10 / CBS 128990) TaxID=675120 RepID=N1PGL4_DOTSN|nr:squalene synthetase-like protein [Dothistroma septosporum NZE10]